MLGESQSVKILTVKLLEEDVEGFTAMLKGNSNIRRLDLDIQSTNAAGMKILTALHASTVSCVDLRFTPRSADGYINTNETLPLSELHALLSSCKWIGALQFEYCTLSDTDVDTLANGIKLNRSLRYLKFVDVTFENEHDSFRENKFRIAAPLFGRWKGVVDAADSHPHLVYFEAHNFLLPIASALMLEGMTYERDFHTEYLHKDLEFISQDYLSKHLKYRARNKREDAEYLCVTAIFPNVYEGPPYYDTENDDGESLLESDLHPSRGNVGPQES